MKGCDSMFTALLTGSSIHLPGSVFAVMTVGVPGQYCLRSYRNRKGNT